MQEFQARLWGNETPRPLSAGPESDPPEPLAFTEPTTGHARSPDPGPPPPPPRPRWWIALAGLLPLLAAGVWYLLQETEPVPSPAAAGSHVTRREEAPQPPPVPPPVIQQGYLQVSVNVAGASVTVDGSTVGHAGPGEPLNLGRGLPVGDVEIAVGAPGYQEQRRRVAIAPNAWAQAHFNLAAEAPARQAFEPELVAIRGGCFQMGSSASEEVRADDERQHRVCVDDFAIGKYEVTQAQWQAVMGSNPSHFSGCSDCPLERVSWNDVQEYIEKLNARTGKHYRLPTEAEWEYAARAGTQTPFWSGDCIHTDQANYDGNYDYAGCGAKTGVYREKTLPVGSLQANPWGLYDVAGNVYEWTCSLYDKKYGGAESKCAGKNDAGSRSLRGGSWLTDPRWVRAAGRYGDAPAGATAPSASVSPRIPFSVSYFSLYGGARGVRQNVGPVDFRSLPNGWAGQPSPGRKRSRMRSAEEPPGRFLEPGPRADRAETDRVETRAPMRRDTNGQEQVQVQGRWCYHARALLPG